MDELERRLESPADLELEQWFLRVPPINSSRKLANECLLLVQLNENAIGYV